MKTYHLAVTLPDGNKVMARARASSLQDEVSIEWSGAVDRLGELAVGKYEVGFLCWYLEGRARQLGGEFTFHEENSSK